MTILELWIDKKIVEIIEVNSGKGSKKQMDEWALRYRDFDFYFVAKPLMKSVYEGALVEERHDYFFKKSVTKRKLKVSW